MNDPFFIGSIFQLTNLLLIIFVILMAALHLILVVKGIKALTIYIHNNENKDIQ